MSNGLVLLIMVPVTLLCVLWMIREQKHFKAHPSRGTPRESEGGDHKRRRVFFFLVYSMAPGYVLVHWRGYEYPMRQAALLAAVAFGGFFGMGVLCTALLPLALKRFTATETAYPWQRAAYDALGYAVMFPLGWVILKFPLPIWLLLLSYLAGVLVLLVALAWLDKRWLHFNVYEGFWGTM
jgi:hypothetical protein